MNGVVNLFWNSREKRLRALWRILIQGAAWFGLQLFLGMGLGVVFILFIGFTGGFSSAGIAQTMDNFMAALSTPGATLALYAGSLVITIGTVWLAGRLLDRRRFADFGFHFSRRWWMDFIFGLFLGAFTLAVVFVVELAAGWIRVTGMFVTDEPGGIFPLAFLLPVLVFLCVGIQEELFSRGYQLKNLAEGLKGSRVGKAGAVLLAMLFSSMFFGLLHGANPNATWISTLDLMVAGVFLALGYILTGELAIPIGMHITWNIFEGNVFGFPVSGITPIAARVLAIQQSGPEAITGGAFGPEAGLIGLAAILIGCGLLILWVRVTRGKIAVAESLAESPSSPSATTTGKPL